MNNTDANTLTSIIYLLIYFIPTIVALSRRPDAGIIFCFNVWFAWTGIGWIIAIVWACYPNKRRATDPVNRQVDLQEFHRQRMKYLDYKLDPQELGYQERKVRIPAVCNRCGESDPCQCQVNEISVLI